MNEGALLIRLALGLIMAYHGTEKLFGWWGGEGLDGASSFFARMGYRPPRVMAMVAGTTETAGGMLVALGLLTPLGCIMLIGTLVNVLALHSRNGLSRRNNGFEYELVLLSVACCVLLGGPGSWSLDEFFKVATIPASLRWIGLALAAVAGVMVVRTRRVSPPGGASA